MTKYLFLTTISTLLLAAYVQSAIVINEVCYENSKVADENGDTSSDWIELYNNGTAGVNVNGYGVGDANPYEEAKGVRLPDYTIPPGGFLLIYANSDIPESTVWTNAPPECAAIPANSSWKYWDAGSAPAGNWRAPIYADSSWESGISPLGHNTTLDNLDCATVLGDPNLPATLHQTIYFRTKFTVLNPSAVTGLVMRARCKDGIAIYLNDTEIYRDNLPQNNLTYSTLALIPVASTSWTEGLLSSAALTQGANTLAIEIHKASATGTAIIMDLALTALVDELIPFVHGAFGLKKEGENAHLFNASLVRIHKCDPPSYEIGKNNSWGTVVDGDISSFKTYYKPTPNLLNTTYNTKYEETASLQVPSLSIPSGFYSPAQSLKLSGSLLTQKVYYTIDGSDPRASTTYVWSGKSIPLNPSAAITSGLAWNRTNPVETGNKISNTGWLAPIGGIDKAVVLRAITVSADGKKCSAESRGTYFIGSQYTNRTLPIFSIITEEANLFGFTAGIYIPGKFYADSPVGYGDNKWGKPYANYHQDNKGQAWERPVSMELFETNQNTSALSLSMGVAMHGGGSRTIPQKTLYMYARNAEYGTKYIDYQLFPAMPATQYKRFLLRNSGNDWYGAASHGYTTMMRDAVFHEIAGTLDISTMAARPAIVYINGEYWGIHNLRESYDKHYLTTRYNIDSENADILTHVDIGKSNIKIERVYGDSQADNEYEAMLVWINSNTLSSNANYQQITNQLDPENYSDYIIAETFFANTDWPQNNCDFWRANSNQTDVAGEYGDQRWRWMLYDLDVAGEEGPEHNMLTYLTDDKMTGINEPAFLINKLWKNAGFKRRFISRYADLLNSTFLPSHTAAKVSNSSQKIAPEIERHFKRWGRTTTQAQWQSGVNTYLIDYLASRHNNSWTHLNSHFGLGGTGTITVKIADSTGTGGRTRVNSLDITTVTDGVDDPANWSGTYFQGVPITVEAIAQPGYEFDGWIGTTLTAARRTLYVGATPTTLIARFRSVGSPPYSAANFEAWQLNNYSEQEIIAGGSCAPDAPSGAAGMSNFEIYAFGMNRNDGLTDAQRFARASLSVHAANSMLFVGYNRLNSSYSDVSYTLKAADALSSPIAWRDAVAGQDYLIESLTNILDSSSWFYQQRLNHHAPGKEKLFFKLEVQRN